MSACAGASRFWFNQALAEVQSLLDARRRGEGVRVSWSYKALCSELDKDWRAQRCAWQSKVVCGGYQGGFESLGLALKNFSEASKAGRRVGFPQFRRKGGPQPDSVIFQRAKPLDARRVHLDNRIGPVRSKERLSKLVRVLACDEYARILRATLSRKGTRWYVSFTVERSRKQRRVRRPDAAVGVDWTRSRLATQRQLNRQRRATTQATTCPTGG